MDVLKLDGYDAHADLVAVEDFLQKLRGFRLDLELAVRQRGVDEAVADDFTHGGFRGVFDHGGLIRHVEQIFHRILDLVLDAELHVDDVLVASEHGSLFRQGTVRTLLEGAPLPYGTEAHFHTLDLRDFGFVDGFYGKGQRVMRAGPDRAVVFAEAQDNALFIGVDDIDAGKQPYGDERDKDPLGLAAGGRGEVRQALEGVGELLIVRPPASVAAPAAERRLFFVIIAVVIVVTPVLPLPFLLELVPVPVHQDSFIWPEKLLRTGACGAHRHGPGIASPFGGGQIHPGAGGIPSVPGLPAKWIQSLQNIGHPAQTVKFI